MALGNLTRQLATQAINDQVNNVLDALKPGDSGKSADHAKPERPAAENLSAQITVEIQAMQKALKEDQELVVLLNTGQEMLRVLEVFVPSAQLLVATGFDADRNVTRVIFPSASAQLVCKVTKVKPDAKPVRVNFITPKP